MALPDANAMAFSMPGGESCGQARSRPVDLVHLARQTMGDRALEQARRPPLPRPSSRLASRRGPGPLPGLTADL